MKLVYPASGIMFPIKVGESRQILDLDYMEGDIAYSFIAKYYKDTLIVFYDSLMSDTMIYIVTDGSQMGKVRREYYRNGKPRILYDVPNKINKAWFPNGQLKWNMVPESNICAVGYRFCDLNKSYFDNGNIRFEMKFIDKDTIQEIYYYPNKNIRTEIYYSFPGLLQHGDGMHYPRNYYNPILLYQRNFCENGQFKEIVGKFWSGDSNIVTYIDDHKTFHCNGKIQFVYEKWDGLNGLGKFKEYYENGILKTEGDLKPSYDSSKTVWKYYDVKGNLVNTIEKSNPDPYIKQD